MEARSAWVIRGLECVDDIGPPGGGAGKRLMSDALFVSAVIGVVASKLGGTEDDVDMNVCLGELKAIGELGMGD